MFMSIFNYLRIICLLFLDYPTWFLRVEVRCTNDIRFQKYVKSSRYSIKIRLMIVCKTPPNWVFRLKYIKKVLKKALDL